MAYCRFSPNQPMCDLYCYNSQDGFITHVGNAGLPHDGASFTDTNLTSFKTRLLELREMGYSVPDKVFERVDAEITEA